MANLARQFEAWYRPVRKDVFRFCKELRFEPTPQQAEMLANVQRAVLDPNAPHAVAAKSGQGCGKTTASGVAAMWLCLRNKGTMVAVTAPTMKQCTGAWREELERTLKPAHPFVRKLVTITKTRIYFGGDYKWGIRFITATKPEAAQGLHEKSMSIIVDEASGVANELMEQWIGTMSNKGDPHRGYPILMMTGNPNTRDSFFFRAFNDLRAKFLCQTMNAEQSPICSEQRNQDVADIYGKDSDVYRIRVLGEFPHADPSSVMSSEDLVRCTQTDMVACSRFSPAKQFGIDFARFGGDEAAIYRRSGNAIVEAWHGSHVEPTRVADMAFRMQTEAGWKNEQCAYVPDAGGMGQGVLGKLYDAKKRVFEFHNGGSATRTEYANKITQAYFQFARLVKTGKCYIPNDPRLIAQLSNRRYYTDKRGRLILEDKEDYRKRTDESPDRADALVMAFWDGTVADSRVATAG